MTEPSEYRHSASIVIARTPEQVYDLVSDVTRTGEWSPICRSCRWDDGDGPQVGAHFTGHNESGERVWDTRCEVVAAEPGKEFGWYVGERYVHWQFSMRPVDGGTELTEAWHFRPEGVAMFAERYGDRAEEQKQDRICAAHDGIPRTLAAMKRIAESEETR